MTTPAAKIPVLYNTMHHLHAPTKEYANGGLVDYPEQPERANNILTALQASGLVKGIEVNHPLALDIIQAVHSPDMVATLANISAEVEDYFYPAVFGVRSTMKKLKHSSAGRLGYYSFDVSAPLGKHSFEAARMSASLAFRGAQMLYNDDAQAVYALCRPPGHHAGRDFIGGYCYLNNAAIAAAYLRTFGKVAILDIDYHHGNGTQHIFWEDEKVFFVSIHADPDLEYPHCNGYADEVGAIPGTNLNIPLPFGTEWPRYQQALEEALAAIHHFAPDYLVISLGFDTYAHDPIATFKLSAEDFGTMGRAIAALGLATLYVQEGGYAVKALGQLATHFFRGVL